MRPIDIDKLKDLEELEYKYFRSPAAVPFYEADKVWEILEAAPTLTYEDLVPHGEWRFVCQIFCNGGYDDIYECSECHEKLSIGIGKSLPNYCSNCGAKMNGGKRE